MKKLLIYSLLMFSGAANAGLISYDWTWTGSSSTGNHAEGTMSYDDALVGTGIITAGDIAEFSIEGFTGTTSQFSWDLSTGAQNNPFQLSFDTTLGDLVFGGTYPTALDSVVWGDDSLAALVCGSGSCGFQGAGLSFDSISVTNKAQFEFTLANSPSPVPAPAAVWLFGSGLIGLIGIRRKSSKSSAFQA